MVIGILVVAPLNRSSGTAVTTPAPIKRIESPGFWPNCPVPWAANQRRYPP